MLSYSLPDTEKEFHSVLTQPSILYDEDDNDSGTGDHQTIITTEKLKSVESLSTQELSILTGTTTATTTPHDGAPMTLNRNDQWTLCQPELSHPIDNNNNFQNNNYNNHHNNNNGIQYVVYPQQQQPVYVPIVQYITQQPLYYYPPAPMMMMPPYLPQPYPPQDPRMMMPANYPQTNNYNNYYPNQNNNNNNFVSPVPPLPAEEPLVIPPEIAKLIAPAFRRHVDPSLQKELNPPEYYYRKVLAAMPINDDPNYLQYSYEKYQPYQFRVKRCPLFHQDDLNSCPYGRNCFFSHASRTDRTVATNMYGGLASVEDVFRWLRTKNAHRESKAKGKKEEEQQTTTTE
ncbi:hypothetical protein ADEAN_000117600 [Angomonas deanei]|uniref:C3H1-type domain-containing protein n=1 Tax=Angomonas deanei TaxID=59799 RepID=A0A7G2C4S6_9TRYP|nr:hypothetical protein ADEAN_000117600 [Angomonas deanei]